MTSVSAFPQSVPAKMSELKAKNLNGVFVGNIIVRFFYCNLHIINFCFNYCVPARERLK